MIAEPQGALTCRSSTLKVLVDFVPFRGLVLTVVGSRSDFHDSRSLGAFTCRSSTLAVLVDSGPFRGLLLTDWGPGVTCAINKPWGAFTCRSSTLAVSADSGSFSGTRSFGRFWPVSWTITHCFGVPECFP